MPMMNLSDIYVRRNEVIDYSLPKPISRGRKTQYEHNSKVRIMIFLNLEIPI